MRQVRPCAWRIRASRRHECADQGRCADARGASGDAGLRGGGAGRRAGVRGGPVSSARSARCGAGRLARSARSAAGHMPDRTGCMNDGAPGMVSRCDAFALPVALLRSCGHPTGLREAACAGYPEYGWRHAAPATGDMRVRPPHLIQMDVCRTPNPLHLMEIAAARPVSPAGRRAIGRMEGSFPHAASSARTGRGFSSPTPADRCDATGVIIPNRARRRTSGTRACLGLAQGVWHIVPCACRLPAARSGRRRLRPPRRPNGA